MLGVPDWRKPSNFAKRCYGGEGPSDLFRVVSRYDDNLDDFEFDHHHHYCHHTSTIFCRFSPFFVDFHHFLSIFAIYALLSRFTFCRNLRTFSAIFLAKIAFSVTSHVFCMYDLGHISCISLVLVACCQMSTKVVIAHFLIFCPRSVRDMPEICPRYAQDIPKIYPRYAQDMPMICPRYAKDIPKICPRYARDMHKMCSRYTQNMPEICPRYTQDMPKICWRYVQDMSKICPRYAQDIPKICPRYAGDMFKICPRYVQDMPEICPTYTREICKKIGAKCPP